LTFTWKGNVMNPKTLLSLTLAFGLLISVGCKRKENGRVPSPAKSKVTAQTLVGKWVVDLPATKEEMKKSPKWQQASEEEKELPKAVEEFIKQMKMVATAEALEFYRGERKNEVPYQVKSVEGNVVVAEMDARGQKVTLTFTFQSDDRMMYKSSATDDMDYYVWTRLKD